MLNDLIPNAEGVKRLLIHINYVQFYSGLNLLRDAVSTLKLSTIYKNVLICTKNKSSA